VGGSRSILLDDAYVDVDVKVEIGTQAEGETPDLDRRELRLGAFWIITFVGGVHCNARGSL
jgi:hypothetical protein